MAWPIAGYPGDSGRTNAEMQAYMDAHLALTKKLAGGPAGLLTTLPGSGIMDSPTSAYHSVRSELGTTDDLNGISFTGLESGHILTIRAYSGHDITVKHGVSSPEVYLEGDAEFVLSDNKMLGLILLSGKWYEIFRTWDADTAGYAAHIGAVSAAGTNLTGQNTAELMNITSNNLDALQVGTAGGAPTEIGSGFVNPDPRNLILNHQMISSLVNPELKELFVLK